MHELALTEGILSIIASEQKQNGFSRVREVHLKIGEFSGVIPECIEEFFPMVAKGTSAEGAALRMETVPARFTCASCGWEGKPAPHTACCASCGGTEIHMKSGREFFVENLTVE
ncbi:MAG: hydrogenase maturation nickel metallochaperone HypA [Oscillospiraceae bacterium]|nr:hydrogenase maturation nickel metallochaperone HypA [Oscillospiraceae bacterium]